MKALLEIDFVNSDKYFRSDDFPPYWYQEYVAAIFYLYYKIPHEQAFHLAEFAKYQDIVILHYGDVPKEYQVTGSITYYYPEACERAIEAFNSDKYYSQFIELDNYHHDYYLNDCDELFRKEEYRLILMTDYSFDPFCIFKHFANKYLPNYTEDQMTALSWFFSCSVYGYNYSFVKNDKIFKLFTLKKQALDFDNEAFVVGASYKVIDIMNCFDFIKSEELESVKVDKVIEAPEERISCAAIKYDNLVTFDCKSPLILKGHRHSDIIETLMLTKGIRTVESQCGEYEQGFVTNKGRFVNRKEAKIIATLANQIISSSTSDSLYSEDLY